MEGAFTTTEPAQRLLLEFLRWIAAKPRTYGDAMDAWRSTCPRISVYEDALIDGLIELDAAKRIVLTARGRAALGEQRASA